jgi:hypothetical protein
MPAVLRDDDASQLFFFGVPRRQAGRFGKRDAAAVPTVFDSVLGAALYLLGARLTRVLDRIGTLSIDEVRALAPPHDVAALCLAALLAPCCPEKPQRALVRLLTEASLLPYEGADARGSLVFGSSPSVLAPFPHAVPFSTPRLLRKMVEASSPGSTVFANAVGLVGVGPPPSNAAPMVRFVRRGVWELRLGSQLLLSVDARGIRLPAADDYQTTLIRAFRASFGHRPDRKVRAAVAAAIEARHGSLLVFRSSSMPDSESSSVAMSFQGVTLPSQVVAALARIDGAIVFDEGGNCWAAGVILAVPVAAPPAANAIERGARFNTAIQCTNHLRATGTNAVVVVVSEDGYVDILSTGASPPTVAAS